MEEDSGHRDIENRDAASPLSARAPSGASTVRAKVFAKDGNRFLIPGMFYFEDDPEASPSNVMLNAMMYGVVCGMEVEKGWLEIPTQNGVAQIAHRSVLLAGRQFAHGGVDVWVIDGPLLAEVAA